MKKSSYWNLKGFTLLEFLVVLVIISLISALLVPKLAGTLTHMNLKTASKKIVSLLRFARSKAISESTEYCVLFDLDNQDVQFFQERETVLNDMDDNEADEVKRKIKKINLPEGSRIKAVEIGGNTIVTGRIKLIFYPEGNITGSKIYLSDERDKKIEINIDFLTGISKIVE